MAVHNNDDNLTKWCEFDDISVRDAAAQNITDHLSVSGNGNEEVSIENLHAVLGKATAFDFTTNTGTDTSGGSYDDYLTVMGQLKVTNFGTSNNVYKLDLSKIATWETP